MTRTALLTAGALLIVASMAPLAIATSLIERTPEQLAQQSALVVDGKVTGVRSYWNADHTRIFTEATVDVDGTYKGRSSAKVSVVQIGGVVDNVRMTAHGALTWAPGEEVLLFLEPNDGRSWQVAGFSQGKYTIERDRSGREFIRQALPPDTKGGGASATSAADGSERVSLEQFLQRVLGR